MRSRPIVVAAGIALILAACHGGLDQIFPPTPSGDIVLTLVGGNGKPLSSSVSSPVHVQNGFSLNVSEKGYSDYFSATVISHTGSSACFAATGPGNAILTFSASCTYPNTDIDGIRVTDKSANSNTQYFENGP